MLSSSDSKKKLSSSDSKKKPSSSDLKRKEPLYRNTWFILGMILLVAVVCVGASIAIYILTKPLPSHIQNDGMWNDPKNFYQDNKAFLDQSDLSLEGCSVEEAKRITDTIVALSGNKDRREQVLSNCKEPVRIKLDALCAAYSKDKSFLYYLDQAIKAIRENKFGDPLLKALSKNPNLKRTLFSDKLAKEISEASTTASDDADFKEHHIKRLTRMLAQNLELSFIENSKSFEFIDIGVLQELRDKFTDENDIIALQHRNTSLTNKETWKDLINYKSCKNISDKITEKISECIKDKKNCKVFNDDEWKLFKETKFDPTQLFFGLHVTSEDYIGLSQLVDPAK